MIVQQSVHVQGDQHRKCTKQRTCDLQYSDVPVRPVISHNVPAIRRPANSQLAVRLPSTGRTKAQCRAQQDQRTETRASRAAVQPTTGAQCAQETRRTQYRGTVREPTVSTP